MKLNITVLSKAVAAQAAALEKIQHLINDVHYYWAASEELALIID